MSGGVRWISRPLAVAVVGGLMSPGSAASQGRLDAEGRRPETREASASLSSEPGVSVHPPVAWAEALEQARHPSDFTRILADGPQHLWDAAALGLLGDHDRLSDYALPVILEHLPALGPEARSRISVALDAERVAALDRYQRGQRPAPEATAPPSPPAPRPAPTRGRGPGATVWLLLGLLVSGWLGVVLFLWGFRLLRLRGLVRGLPPSTARSLALGQVALQGEAQPLDGQSLTHPDTGEVCLYYEGGDENGRGLRFCVVDETGRVTVDPDGAVLLSADGVIVPGERVHLIGEARRARPGPDDRVGEVTVGAPAHRRSAFQKGAQLLVGSVMGGLFGRGSARMLFTDPLHCFWVWDDLQATPFTRPRETAWLVGAFVLAGGWVLVFLSATVALLDR